MNSEFGYRWTRGANKLHLLQLNTNSYRNTFVFQGVQCYNNLPLPWDKSQTILPSDLLWFLHVGTNLSARIHLSYFLHFLFCAVFNFYSVCIVIAQLYLICFVPSWFGFLCTQYMYPGLLCKPTTCVDTAFLFQIKISIYLSV